MNAELKWWLLSLLGATLMVGALDLSDIATLAFIVGLCIFVTCWQKYVEAGKK
mgnify:CR=1 FL=1